MAAAEAVVLDSGHFTSRAGLAGDDLPSSIISSEVGRTPGCPDVVGDAISPGMARHRAIDFACVTDWTAMESIWKHLLFNELRVAPEEHAVLVTEPFLGTSAQRTKPTEIMFESFDVPAFYLALRSVLATYATGRTTALSLHVGHNSMTTTPVYEGYAMPHAMRRQLYGGEAVEDELKRLLSIPDLSPSIAREMVRHFCQAAPRPFPGLATSSVTLSIPFWTLDSRACASLQQGLLNASSSLYFGSLPREITEMICQYTKSSPVMQPIVRAIADLGSSYVLPDGRELHLAAERFAAPEVLFHTGPYRGYDRSGLSDLIDESIMRCDPTIRQEMYHAVICGGGGSLLYGLPERVQYDLTQLAPPKTKVVVLASPERQHLAWIGGSIMTSLTTFEKMWISKQEYDEAGPSIVYRKCF